MSKFQVNLSNCDNEPIHVPGRVQSHGFLIALDFENIICFCSENIKDFLGVSAENLLEKPLADLEIILNNDVQHDFLTKLLIMANSKRDFAINNPMKL
ncbi:MAG: hypothetical protein EOO93_19700 [Pedobacter sp.]|nr:MAG: hypothetical protein EOO93_19700 [Pedobacter sp.]